MNVSALDREMVVRKSVMVACPPERAFEVFTREYARWWPFATHSVGELETETVAFEPGVGGRIYERTRAGTEYDWGTVLSWEPPARVVFTWHPGMEPDTAQEVEVTFSAEGRGTRVVLEHRGWEKLPAEQAAEMMKGYNAGWETVFGACFAKAC